MVLFGAKAGGVGTSRPDFMDMFELHDGIPLLRAHRRPPWRQGLQQKSLDQLSGNWKTCITCKGHECKLSESPIRRGLKMAKTDC